MFDSQPYLSVIIATCGRKEILKMMLERLSLQSLAPESYEVIVVDDGSKDGTSEMIDSMATSLPYQVRYFYQERKGPGGANNTGARNARADIIVFLANDMLAVPEALEAHYKSHLNNPAENIAVVGKLRESPEQPQTAFQKAWDPFEGCELDGKNNLGEFDLWVSNFSMKRRFFLEHGIFIEYPGPAMEDNELANRLFKKGLKLIYCPEALTYHYHPQTIDSIIKRVYATGRNLHIYETLVEDVIFFKNYKVLSPRLDRISYVQIFLRDVFRSCLFNRITIPYIAVPLIRKAETCVFLERFVKFLHKRTSGYYFRKGISDSRKLKKENAEATIS